MIYIIQGNTVTLHTSQRLTRLSLVVGECRGEGVCGRERKGLIREVDNFLLHKLLFKFQARDTLLPRQHITATYMCCLHVGDVYMML